MCLHFFFKLPAVNKAYKTLEDPDEIEYCKGIWEEAVATVNQQVCAHWYIGTLVYLVHWYIGTLVYWCIGILVHWYTGILVHWYTGTLVYWYIGMVY